MKKFKFRIAKRTFAELAGPSLERGFIAIISSVSLGLNGPSNYDKLCGKHPVIFSLLYF